MRFALVTDNFFQNIVLQEIRVNLRSFGIHLGNKKKFKFDFCKTLPESSIASAKLESLRV